MSNVIELIFGIDSLDALVAARQSVAALGIADQRVVRSSLEGLKTEGPPHFRIEAGAFSIDFSTIKAYQQQLLVIRKEEPWSFADWESAVEYFLGCDGFTQACLESEEYTFWQNASDPIQYEAAGRSCDGLPLVSNGLPSPLNQLVVDTSKNPGRRVIKVGYVEMVGHVMWLGRPFWGLVGDHRREELLAKSAYQVTELRNGVVRVVASENPFVDDTTSEIQDEFRRVLFGVAPFSRTERKAPFA